jgi:DNA-binding beta-propeller fold protein YncE
MSNFTRVTALAMLATCLATSLAGAEEPPVFLTMWGQFGTGPGDFNRASDVAVGSSGTIYVADFANSRIQRFTANGTYLDEWPTPPVSNADVLPRSIALDSADNVFVVDQANARILKYTATGTLLTVWGSFGTSDGQFRFPAGIAVGPGDHVYVADSNNFRIQEFIGTGLHVRSIGSSSTPAVELGLLGGVAVDHDGNIFTSELNPDRVTKIDSGGNLVLRWGTHGSADGEFDSPGDLCIDRDGNVYVLDQVFPAFEPSNHRAQKFTNDGGFLSDWGGFGSAAGLFSDPHGIAVDALGDIYIADTNNDRVQKFGIDIPVEIAIADFDVVRSGSGVEVRWRAVVTGDASFEIWRRDEPGAAYQRVGGMEAHRGEQRFSFSDLTVHLGAAYSYKLAYRDGDAWMFTSALRIVLDPAPVWLTTRSNPSRGEVHIEYAVGPDGQARLEVFDVAGTRVRLLMDGRVAVGAGAASWDGRDERGRSVPAGRYFVRLVTHAATRTRSIILMH